MGCSKRAAEERIAEGRLSADPRRNFIAEARELLDGTTPPEQRAWDSEIGHQGRRVLAELAGLPLELRIKPWRELTGAEQRRVRIAAQRARGIGAAFSGIGAAGEGGK